MREWLRRRRRWRERRVRISGRTKMIRRNIMVDNRTQELPGIVHMELILAFSVSRLDSLQLGLGWISIGAGYLVNFNIRSDIQQFNLLYLTTKISLNKSKIS